MMSNKLQVRMIYPHAVVIKKEHRNPLQIGSGTRWFFDNDDEDNVLMSLKNQPYIDYYFVLEKPLHETPLYGPDRDSIICASIISPKKAWKNAFNKIQKEVFEIMVNK